jgi:high-affinity nickel-transport protein
MMGFIALLHVVGWGLLVAVVAPAEYHVGGQVFGVGLGVTAYTLGMRHAFDADHIAAIDNTTRKLLSDVRAGHPRKPLSVGFWFSLGHSSVVFVMVMLLSFGVRALASAIGDGGSGLVQGAAAWGTSISGLFLVVIGLVNLGACIGIAKVFGRMRREPVPQEVLEHELEAQLAKRGFLTRILGRVTRAVTKPWHMYPVGFLFGLGFDTVTEVGLLVMAGGAAAANLPWYAVLTLPVLFAAGMSLLDTVDGVFMTAAYGWAQSRPVRKIYYNLVVTALSVAVALGIGVIELVSVASDRLGVTSGPLAALAAIDLGDVGFWIVGLFAATWLVSAAFWRLGRVEEKWATATPR